MGALGPRAKHTVFCGEHHEEQLSRFATAPVTTPAHALRCKCERIVRTRQAGLCTDEQMYSSLLDVFIHSDKDGLAAYWDAGLDALSASVLSTFLSYVKAYPAPRIFLPRSTNPQWQAETERVALKAQAELIARLEAHVGF